MAVLEASPGKAPGPTIGGLVLATLAGGALAGLFDIGYACGRWALEGVAPERILQSVAAGLLGASAFEGGQETAALGLVLHFAMTTLMALVFSLASLMLTPLRARPIVSGLIYGAAAFFVMRYVVVPLSESPLGLPKWPSALTELGVHIFLVGLPIALAARRLLGKPSSKAIGQ